MIKNFLFHRVFPERDPLWDPMDVDLFDRCIRFISRRYEVVLLEHLLPQLNNSKTRPYATILFDDGYKDNIEYALPILQKYGVKASFYVVTNCIDFNLPTWTYILDYRFQNTMEKRLELKQDFLPASLHITRLNTPEDRIAYVKKLKPYLKKLSHVQRTEILAIIDQAFCDVQLPSLMMNWDEVRQLASEGHYVGSHTVTHGMLGTMDNETTIRSELLDSGKKIQSHLGYFPKTISYPVGSYNKTTMRLAKEAGYEFGLAVNQLPYFPASQSLFDIPRIELYNEPWLKTRIRISNLFRNFSNLLK